MNKIFKVIWSKSRNCYVVASELAKGHTKASSTGDKTRRLALAAITALMLLPVGGFSYAADTATVTDTSGNPQTVYTKEGTDSLLEKGLNGIAELSTQVQSEFEVVSDAIEVQDGAIVKKNNTIGENVTNLDAALAKETAARLGADAAQDKVIKQVNDNLVASVNTINQNMATINQNVADGFTALSQADANEVATREAKDNELNERITNEANAIHETTNQLQSDLNTETTAREAADTALDTRITNVKEYLEKQTSDNYVSKTDAAVQDGAIVKAANTIGENVTNLDAALAKETAARIGADAAQDKVIEQVNQNMVDGFNTINKNMADGFTALSQADANELAGRVAADTKLAEAVNGGLSLSDNNVLQKNTTKVNSDGTVSTSKEAATTLVMNEGKENQITLSENGVKVGTNSSVMDANGVYTGGDTYDAAKAALKSDGSIKGANGAFTVDENGNVTSKATITGETVTDGKGASMSNGTVTGKTLTDGIATITNGNINTSGTISGGTVTSTGNISALGDIHAGGAITGASASIQGALTAGSATITGDLTAGGAIQGKSISDGTATMQNGNLTGVKNLSAETITTSGDATIGGDLTVNGKLNVDEIDLTKNGIVGDNNVTASTKVAAGEITGYKKATSTKDGSEKESAIDYDENGTSTWAKSTDADGNWNKSTLTVEGSDVTSKVIDSEKNSNQSTQTSTQSQSTLTDKDNNTNTATQSATESNSTLKDKDGKTSTFQQRVGEILNQINSSDTVFSKVDQKTDTITSEVTDGTNTTSSTQTTKDITNTATNGTISNNAKELTNTASDSITNKAENGNISNIASNGTISNEAMTISNKAAEAMTNDAKTITNTASESVTTQIGDGSTVKSVMNDAGIANTATGKAITNDAATITNTGTTSVTNQVGNNKVLVDTTHVQSAFGDTIYTTWDESGITNNATDKMVATNAKDILNTATGNITNSAANGTITNTAKDLVNTATGNMTNTVGGELKTTVTGKATENYNGGLETTITGEEKHTVNGNQINNITGDQTNTINGKQTTTVTGDVTEDYKANLSTTVGGNQTTTVTGDSSLTAENINNTAKNKITNKALDVETDASSSIVSKVSNDAGSNTSTQLSYQTKEEMSQADGKTASYLRGAAEEKSQLTDGDKKTTIDTVAGQTNTNITEGKNISNSLQKADQVASSVTDGTNTTVVNQDAKSLASSITDGTKANNTNSTVDKSEQLIKASDTQYSATSKTATKTEDTLVNGSTIIDILKDSTTGTVSSIVTDGTNSTGVTQTAKDITNTAKNGTIANDAKDIVNNAAENMTNTIGKDLTTTVGGEMKTTVTGKATENYNGGLETTITGEEKHTVNGDQTNNITGSQTNTIGGSQTTTVTGDSSLSAKNITNSATEKLSNSAAEIENTASKSITDKVGDNVSTTMSTDSIVNKVGKTTITTTDGKTKLTNEDGTHETEMDYATVLKDLGVRGSATVDQNLTVKGDSDLQGNATVSKNLTVNGTSDLKGDVTMESSATVKKDLTVEGTTTTDKLVVNNGATVTGGTTTDTLHVTSTSTFDGTATFKDVVTMEKDLSVGGNATVAGSMTASSYKVGDKTYIDANGINANNQKITNVAAGDLSASSTDAVNGAQLYQTNERVTGVENKVNNLDSRVDKVGANAAALANLHPLEFDADSKWNIAAAVGGYKGETATAIGAFYRPNENVMVNVSSSFGTGENMYGGGISLRIGQGGNKARRNATNGLTDREKAMQKQIDSLTNRLDALLSVINPNMSKEFPDVPENHWAYEAVSKLAGNGIIQGYEDGKYHGERTMTRYEMAEIIYNALSKGAKAEKKLVEEFKPELQAMAAQKKA